MSTYFRKNMKKSSITIFLSYTLRNNGFWENVNLAGYRRFVAYVYEYPDEKKGDGKGFIKVEVRDGRCRMNYRISGIRGRESVPCKIYGFVRRENDCEGVLLGECDLAGDVVQFQQEMPETQLGGSPYSLGDLGGVIMLTDNGLMYGTGWDEKPVRLREIRLPRETAPEKDSIMEKNVPEEPLPFPLSKEMPERGERDKEQEDAERIREAEPPRNIQEIDMPEEVPADDGMNPPEDDWPFIDEALREEELHEITGEETGEIDAVQEEAVEDSDETEEIYDTIQEIEEIRSGGEENRDEIQEEIQEEAEPETDAPVETENINEEGMSVEESMSNDDYAFHGNYGGKAEQEEDNSTWNPAGDGQEEGPDILEELDQDEEAIRHMRKVQMEEEERSGSSQQEEQVKGQEAQAAAVKAVFCPFTDGEIADCTQITPADFRILSHRDRGLMNNNFLRHGYYRYHHILLGRRREDGRYILGVPGVYNRQECLMAGMFGFPNFKAAKGNNNSQRFGYWFRLIDTPGIYRGNRP